ncbi:Transcription initiation factor TFIID TATA-box binding protein [Monocercomonoides exilis]|uniref:Transcription initiation factor TFIID TATA-box binding protein n=1 Tax=Monocercomonoides exilis TaxID=2049356 RepID=UPI00355A48B6|nr:Transcription initiation factor TFIID TATA-box binding protein [Monocercomonoides exilis]|eukprot:MONOS_1098.1-p1 / transcript=MONOS_1098.1 / gene=MONOS_1098 / organism=Monocercomonoides_exilis_PA203 / gene_product=Transcription initiation factor TFIID TATA-box binding protein / transcript_product=Transcription initiation factor TFIID TATA-box binding protein / location=Mono_scaffold00018:206509-207434(+) / protein_length=226 / sequence_SO=supercontig / SO=protein_coding / is_pseudo=false
MAIKPSDVQTGRSADVDLSEHPSGIIPQIQNVVATAFLGSRVNLRTIASNVRNVEHNPRRFPAAVFRLRDPKATVLIFESGKMVCTGAKSEELARLACRRTAKTIHKIPEHEGIHITFQNFKIENLVASCDVRFPIRLEALAAAHTNFSTYEPEMFPGLVYRMTTTKITFLIFVSGKVVITGAKSRNDIYTAFEELYPVLRQFSKTIARSTQSFISKMSRGFKKR